MQIRHSNRNLINWRYQRFNHFRWRILTAFLIAVTAGTIALGGIWYGVRLEVSGQALAYFERWQYIKQGLTNPRQTISNYWRSLRVQPKKISLDFKFEDWQLLSAKQQEAILSGSLYESNNPWVKGWLNYNGKKIRIRAKLKGGPEHFNSDKWSIRIDLDDKNETFLGMQSFAIQHPKTRFYLSEWLFHQMLAHEGLIALQYQFIDVTINGRHKGIYAVEEHFTTQLVERNERREGPILVFSEDLYNYNYWPQAVWRNEVRRLDAYQEDKFIADPILADQVLAARTLLDKLRLGEAQTCDVFVCDLLARYFAILDILGAEHAAVGGNFKMYYNPVLAKLEPVGYDAEPEFGTHALFINEWQYYKNATDSVSWLRNIFSDQRFMEKFLFELSRLAEPGYLENFYSAIAADRDQTLSVIHKEFPNYNFDWGAVLSHRQIINKILTANNLVDAYVTDRQGSRIVVELGNVMTVPVTVSGFLYNNQTIDLPDPIVLPALALNANVVFQPVTITLPGSVPADSLDGIQVRYHFLGLTKTKLDDVSSSPRLLNGELSQQALSLQPNYRDFSFIKVNDEEKQLVINRGHYEIAETLVIPAPYALIVEPGTIIDLKHNASIISYGSVQLNGQLSAPVQITSSDSSGGGIAVLQAKTPSNWRHAQINFLRPHSTPGWQLTGSVTFYESPINLEFVSLSDNQAGDDLLNIIRSNFKLSDVTLSQALNDALDVDFGRGEIIRTRVSRSGNDAFDFSGSSVVLREVEVKQFGDKGISAGEGSQVQAFDTSINEGPIGLASKDISQVFFSRGRIGDVALGVSAYQKKPEFGPAEITLQKVDLSAIQPHLIESNSKLNWDDNIINGQEKDVLKQTESTVAQYSKPIKPDKL